MSEQGIVALLVVILLAILASWLTTVRMLTRDRHDISDVQADVDDKDERVLMLEDNADANEKLQEKRHEEVLEGLRKRGGL